jgi:hypothetical protein
MIITADDGILNEIIHNKLSLDINDGYALPLRFTEKQLKLYASLNDNFRKNSLSTAGVCLDFITDSGYLNLKVAYMKTTLKSAYFDLYINGYFVNSICSEITIGEDCNVAFMFPENTQRMKRVTIYLPYMVATYIKEIDSEDNSTIEIVSNYKENYLCLGGSIAQGMMVIRPSSMYAIQLARFLNMNLINQGVGGYYFEADSLDNSLPFHPNLITVAYGGNEKKVCSSMDEFKDRCFCFMEKLVFLYPSARIFIIPPTWRKSYNQETSIGTCHDVTRIIHEVCQKFAGVYVFDSLKLVPHMDNLYGDGLHPLDEGFLHFSINMLPDILRELKKESI